MGERKVQNKYYPPDFDPSKIPKGVRKRSHKVRMMMPMSVQCNVCGEYVYNGKKFNALIEPVTNEDYLGIQIFRLAIRCPNCSNNITIKTDPANCDYICEMGATRNFEPWRTHNLEEAEKEAMREEARLDIMWNLEAKTYDAQKEMDALEQLDELKSMRARQSLLSTAEILAKKAKWKALEDQLCIEDEEELQEFSKKQEERAQEKKMEDLVKRGTMAEKPKEEKSGLLGGGIVITKKKRKIEKTGEPKKTPATPVKKNEAAPAASAPSLVSYD